VILEGSDIALAIPRGHVAFSFPIRLVSTVANAIKPGDRVDVMLSWTVIAVDADLQIRRPVSLFGEEDCLAGCQAQGEQIPGLVSQYTVQNALVLGIGFWDVDAPAIQVLEAGEEPGEETVIPPPVTEGEAQTTEEAPPEQQTTTSPLSQVTVVTLAVEPQYALVLKWSVESDSSMDLVLRSAADIEDFSQPEAVTLEYMFNRYDISLPPRLPNALENEFDYLKDADLYGTGAGGE
jgi:Flp pilus assembly protein CpaB